MVTKRERPNLHHLVVEVGEQDFKYFVHTIYAAKFSGHFFTIAIPCTKMDNKARGKRIEEERKGKLLSGDKTDRTESGDKTDQTESCQSSVVPSKTVNLPKVCMSLECLPKAINRAIEPYTTSSCPCRGIYSYKDFSKESTTGGAK